ncbi:DNA mismatch repair protein [Cyclospora cayetanensis]|uniref:DNA mismatch repair protein n=1 Tax=Cyclospora cayetanensis TaxID=88456 RepID=A0A1D3D2I5_9EIME|nr:DNA mismatch repair protein [Cyclospora cayetanensis]
MQLEVLERTPQLAVCATQEVFRRDVFQRHFKHVAELDRLSTKLHRIHAAVQAAKEGASTKPPSSARLGVGVEDLVKLYDCVVECNSLLGPLGSYAGPCAATVRTEIHDKLHAIVCAFAPFIQLVEHSIDLEEAKKGSYIISQRFDPRMGEALKRRDALLCKLQAERQAAEELLDLPRRREGDAVKLIEDPTLGFALRVVKRDQPAVLGRKKEFQQVRLNKNEMLFTTNRVKLLAAKHREVCEEYQQLQSTLVEKATQVAATYWPLTEQLAELLGTIDVLGAFAAVALNAPAVYVRPRMEPEGSELRLEACRHALLEVQGVQQSSVIANSCIMNAENARLHVITGPNMGGKSTYIRQVALCVFLAQMGSFVPCVSCTLPVFKQIMCRVGASDLQLRGVSTFLAEMVEASAILRTAGPQSLVIVDELGRGTSTYEGFGLAWGIAKDLVERARCFTLFATHFLELSALEGAVQGVRNYHVKAAVCKEKQRITFLYNLQEGHADQSYGIHVAQFAGLPDAITQRAVTMSQQLEAAEKREKRRSVGALVGADAGRDCALKKLKGLVTSAFAAETPEVFSETVRKEASDIRNCLRELEHYAQTQVASA